jgi:hypothetical protein
MPDYRREKPKKHIMVDQRNGMILECDSLDELKKLALQLAPEEQPRHSRFKFYQVTRLKDHEIW